MQAAVPKRAPGNELAKLLAAKQEECEQLLRELEALKDEVQFLREKATGSCTESGATMSAGILEAPRLPTPCHKQGC